ncbi:MAG: hypothetical protein L6R41_008340 [Letrouitia leprolyta]|nr:MAG: hypothetical protein L6R41_008340 [Letrouitia leprolyta]
MEHLKHFDEVLKYVNELSNTIDLPSTILRAQKLFRRFQRTVEAVDRKQSFPAPGVRQRKPAVASSSQGTTALKGHGAAATGNDTVTSEAGGEQKVISPELRNLLSRKVEKLDKKTVVEHGGGVG